MMVQTATALAAGELSDKIGNLQSEKDQLKVSLYCSNIFPFKTTVVVTNLLNIGSTFQESLTRQTTDYSRLLKMSEDLTDQLEEKQLANIELEKNLQTARYDYAQLKNDVQVILEQRLQDSQQNAKTLKGVSS